MRKHLLLTNDDGIESGFLKAIADALAKRFTITIAAPAEEQSWIGRAVSRRGPVSVTAAGGMGYRAWSIGGTPTDCVNIALGNLLESPPDAVVSGINIGYNTTVPLVYSSGTVAGAMEGAFWGLPAFAISQAIPDFLFSKVSEARGRLPDEWQPVLEGNAAHAAELIERLLQDYPPVREPEEPPEAIVHNLNYPSNPLHPYETVLTIPAPLLELPFYKKRDSNTYQFSFQHGRPVKAPRLTDREALAEGRVSHSILNFSHLGRDLNH